MFVGIYMNIQLCYVSYSNIFKGANQALKVCVQTRLFETYRVLSIFDKIQYFSQLSLCCPYDKIENTHLGIYLYGITHCMFTYIEHHTYTYGVTTVRIASNFSASKQYTFVCTVHSMDTQEEPSHPETMRYIPTHPLSLNSSLVGNEIKRRPTPCNVYIALMADVKARCQLMTIFGILLE